MKARVIALGLSATLIPLATFGREFDGLLSEPDLGVAIGGAFVETSPRASGGWRFGGGLAPLVGVDAKFSGLGVFRSPSMLQPPGGGQNYNYDNGFVRLDSTGNGGGNTWNWSYDGAAQFNPAGGGSISYSISKALGNGAVSGGDEFAGGIEAFAYYEVGELPALNLGGGPARWGVKATLHYANISIEDAGSFTVGVSTVTDRFALNGVVPPLAPYAGSFNGPGPVLADSPTRSTVVNPGGAIVAGNREVEVNLFGLTVGPYLEVPVSERVTVSLEGGLSLAVAEGDYEFNSITTIAGLGTQANAGSGNKTTVLPGVSAGLTAFYEMSDAWSAHGGVRYQYYSALEIAAGSSTAEVDFGSAFIVSVGLTFRH